MSEETFEELLDDVLGIANLHLDYWGENQVEFDKLEKIRKRAIDKQRVKEAINKNKDYGIEHYGCIDLEEFKKELGLEDE